MPSLIDEDKLREINREIMEMYVDVIRDVYKEQPDKLREMLHNLGIDNKTFETCNIRNYNRQDHN